MSEGTFALFCGSLLIVDNDASSQCGGTWTVKPTACLSIDVQLGCDTADGEGEGEGDA